MKIPLNQMHPCMLAAISIVLGACGQVLMKIGASGLVLSIPDNALLQLSHLSAVLMPHVMWIGLGITSYGLALMTWLGVLARVELSIAYPLLSIGYVLVYLVAITCPQIGEEPSALRTTGIMLICCGVILVTRSERSSLWFNRPSHTYP